MFCSGIQNFDSPGTSMNTDPYLETPDADIDMTGHTTTMDLKTIIRKSLPIYTPSLKLYR